MRIGIDLVDIARLERSMRRSPTIASKIFSDGENELASSLAVARRAEFYAGRFAVKEAVVKALGLGIDFNTLPELQTLTRPNGAPFLTVGGRWGVAMRKMALRAAHVSISHEGGFAVAMVVLNP